MKKTEYITDRSGKVVGRIEADKVYDRAGKLQGRHNQTENRTYDRGGKYVGQGDLRVQLIK